jgi:hypothetical protein
MSKPTQTQNGKAFEYALITEAQNILRARGFIIDLIIDNTYNTCQQYFNLFSLKHQTRYLLAAEAAINHIISLEPRLIHSKNANDILTLKLQPDSSGQAGDVRDILFIRLAQSWSIGISAKNNHKALKHSRLSGINDFGTSWVGVPCSTSYFKAISPTFAALTALKAQKSSWNMLKNKHNTYYLPILNAFKNELTAINAANKNIPQKLITYLVGSNDFYKVIKRTKVVEIVAFNIHGTLGSGISGHRPSTPVPKLKLPTMITHFQMAGGKSDTLSMICDKGWQLSFRIHNASTLVEPSLKFDVNLVGNPSAIYSHHIPY